MYTIEYRNNKIYFLVFFIRNVSIIRFFDLNRYSNGKALRQIKLLEKNLAQNKRKNWLKDPMVEIEFLEIFLINIYLQGNSK